MRALSQSSIQPVRDSVVLPTYSSSSVPSSPYPPFLFFFPVSATFPISLGSKSIESLGRPIPNHILEILLEENWAILFRERERERSRDEQFPPGRISGFSGVEREDEVYSARQLAARDTEKAVKPEEPADPILVEPLLATKLRLRVQVNNNNNSSSSDNNNKSNKGNDNLEEATLDGSEERFSLSAAQQPEIGIDSFDRAKPLTVTSSTFRAADNKPRRGQDGSRKDNTFPRPVQSTEKSFVGVEALKQSLEESIKENNEPKKKQQCRQQSAGGRAPFEFQVRAQIRVFGSGRITLGERSFRVNPRWNTIRRPLFARTDRTWSPDTCSLPLPRSNSRNSRSLADHRHKQRLRVSSHLVPRT